MNQTGSSNISGRIDRNEQQEEKRKLGLTNHWPHVMDLGTATRLEVFFGLPPFISSVVIRWISFVFFIIFRFWFAFVCLTYSVVLPKIFRF